MKHTVLGAAVALVGFAATAQADPLELNVYRTDPSGFEVASVLVTGDTEAVLIDGQFAKSEARKVIDMVRDSGKELTTIYVSHGDPDYYFGLDVITEAFPDAEVYATAETIAHIEATMEQKVGFWGPKLGEDAPSRIVVPEVVPGDRLTVDGEELVIYGKDGADADHTHIWIPSIKAVVGGVSVMGNQHVFVADVGTPEKRAERIVTLESLKALNPETVIPGHATPDAPLTVASIQHTIDYLKAYEPAVEKAEGSEELMAIMTELYPNAGCGICLELGAKVAEGEMTW